MSESIEKQARKALRRMVFWRIVGELFMLPQAVVIGLMAFLQHMVGWLKSAEMSLFYLELDAARRYKLLTGSDLGAASSAPARYGLLNHPDLTDDMQRMLVERHLSEDVEDE